MWQEHPQQQQQRGDGACCAAMSPPSSLAGGRDLMVSDGVHALRGNSGPQSGGGAPRRPHGREGEREERS